VLVERGSLLIVPTSVSSDEAFGIPVVGFGKVLQLTSIDSGETFGLAVVEIGARKFWLGPLHVEAIKVGESSVTAGYVGSALVF
jgi:hypothetical protein